MPYSSRERCHRHRQRNRSRYDVCCSYSFTAFIVESILNPRSYIAPEYEMITTFTKDGKEITGRKRLQYDHRGREDPETVQILDDSGKLWTTYFKKDLRSTSVPQAGVMPENFADILSVKQSMTFWRICSHFNSSQQSGRFALGFQVKRFSLTGETPKQKPSLLMADGFRWLTLFCHLTARNILG